MKTSQQALTNFVWRGINHEGKNLQGMLLAKTLSLAKMQLQHQGIHVTHIHKESKLWKILTAKSIKSSEIVSFSRQLATLTTANIPLLSALDLIAKSTSNSHLTKLVYTIKHAVESGIPLHEAFRKHSKYFDSLFCNLIDAGEQSGALDMLLERIAEYKEKTQMLKKKLRKALSYPLAVISITSIVTTILLVKVIPQFESLFQSAGSNLPTFTKLVIKLAEFLQHHWLKIFIVILILVLSSIFLRKNSRKFHKITDLIWLKMPIFGSIAEKATIARFCRTLATTFAAGMPILNALEISAKAANNLLYQDAIIKMRDDIATGEQFNYAMQKTETFPNMIVQMAAIGEESGKLDVMMNKAASIYEEDVEVLVDNLSNLLEPIIMSILGIIVGGLVIAMYLPIFKIGQAF